MWLLHVGIGTTLEWYFDSTGSQARFSFLKKMVVKLALRQPLSFFVLLTMTNDEDWTMLPYLLITIKWQ